MESKNVTVAFTGATRNFFKVGHAAIHVLARNYPNVKIRLALPDVEIAKSACEGAEVEFVQWDLSKSESLVEAYEGCNSVLMVPPIQDRIGVGEMYLDAAKKAGVEFICCIGVQYRNTDLKLSREADKLEEMLVSSGIPHCTLHLPMFLENLLYQTSSIKKNGEFYYPCKPESKFSYLTCSDLGQVVARMLSKFEVYENTNWTAQNQTTCEEIAKLFSKSLNKEIRFIRVTDDQFIEGLKKDGMSKHASEGILELWKEIDKGNDLLPNNTFTEILGRDPESVDEWIKEHVCCFTPNAKCKHPQPPFKH
jgi:uncharacterized protein YbjT (DUF2867 family)